MCPVCLTSLTLTVATTTGAGAAVTALALRVRRRWKRDRQPEARTHEEPHAPAESSRGARP